MNKNKLPKNFPFWARLKISKNRTTLIIDEDIVINKKSKKEEDSFVHREATSKEHKGYEKIFPNPDSSKKEAMYIKPPRKIPKYMVKNHNKKLSMPKHLKDKYNKNSYK